MGPLSAKFVSYALSLIKTAALAQGKKQLAEWSTLAQLQRGIAADQRVVVEILRRAAIDVVRGGIAGRDLDGDQALQFLSTRAADPMTPRRLRALWNEASISADDRVAMLAVGYFVGASEPSLRDRLDWALRGLFQADADVLGTVVEHRSQLEPRQEQLALELKGASQDSWVLAATVPHKMPERGPAVPAQSLLALNNAQCLTVSDGGDQPERIVSQDPPQVGRVHLVTLLPLGNELHRILSTIDWREIARRRNAR